ncbi:MAG: THUMP domain-containing protein [Nanobdellota archaeon]
MFIVRYGEIALKGKNRIFFEKQLIRNIKDCLKKHGENGRITRTQSRLLVESEYIGALRKVFGIHSLSPCVECEIPAIKEHLPISHFMPETRFRVSVQRVDKSIKASSAEMERELGAFVVEQTGAKVDLKGFEAEVGVELFSNKAYVFSERIDGPGGLPVGSQGRCTALITDRFSELAALLAMKRGCALDLQGKSKLLERFEYGFRLGAAEDMSVVVQGRRDVPEERTHALELDPLVGLTIEECEELLQWYTTL